MVPADKAANNAVVVCRLHYVNTLKQELDGTRAYLETDTDEVSLVNAHLHDLPVKFSVCVNEGQDKLPTMHGDVPRRASYGVYISQLIRFARVCNHVTDFNARNKCLTAKLLQQGYRYHKLRKIFSKFYRRHYELISKYNVGLKTLLSEGLSEPEFYGDLD